MAGLKGITVNTAPEAEPHIYAEDDAAIFQAMFGEDGVSSIGQACKATVLSNNKVRIADGVLCVGGHFARIPYGEYVDCEIANGQSGKNRNDIIVAKFVTTGSGGIDTMTCEVKQGTANTTATDPTLTQNDIYKGGKIRELPLYRVKLEGLNITAVEQLFIVNPTNKDLSDKVAELNGKSGTLTSADQNNPITEYQLYKMGKMVVFNVTNYRKGQGAVNGRVIGTIQEGFLPPHTIAISFGTSGADQFDSSGNPGSRIFVNDAGVVTLYCNKNTGNYISFTACWVTD